MKVVFLGTGTSVGIPMIGCDCRVCASSDPRNRRRRSSIYVAAGGTHLVIDTSLDFRDQALTFKVPRVDAVLMTHSHADHIFGLDDIRRFNTIQGQAIPVHGSGETIRDLKRIFSYINATPSPPGVYRPEIEFLETRGPWTVGAIRIEPLPVEHSTCETLGFRLEADGRTVGYVPDCHALPEAAFARLRGVDVMILDGLRHRPHPTHLTVEASVALLQRMGARHSYLTHLCHDLDHEETQESLPPAIFVSCDGMTLEW